MIDFLMYDDFIIAVSLINGNFVKYRNDQFSSLEELTAFLQENRMYGRLKYSYNSPKDYYNRILLHINVNKYYSNEEKGINVEMIGKMKSFIDLAVKDNPQNKIFLLSLYSDSKIENSMDAVIEIVNHCNKVNEKLGINIISCIRSNVSLFTKESIKVLENSSVAFVYSCDGEKQQDYLLCKTCPNGKTCGYVKKNIKYATNHFPTVFKVHTGTGNMDFVRILKIAVKNNSLCSMRPSFTSEDELIINDKNIKGFISSYKILYDFLLKETIKGNLKYIKSILGWDDSFGEYINRVILDFKAYAPCNAYGGGYTFTGDGELYTCKKAVGIKKLCIGNLTDGIDIEKQNDLFKRIIKKEHCNVCFAKFVCGGHCMVNSFRKSQDINANDDIACRLNKYLVKLSYLFCTTLLEVNHEAYTQVYKTCVKKIYNVFDD